MKHLPLFKDMPLVEMDFGNVDIVDNFYYILLFLNTGSIKYPLRVSILRSMTYSTNDNENVMCFFNYLTARSSVDMKEMNQGTTVAIIVPGRALTLLKKYNGCLEKAFEQCNREMIKVVPYEIDPFVQ